MEEGRTNFEFVSRSFLKNKKRIILTIVMLHENNLFQRAASSAYASMAAFTAAANMYNSFYPTTASTNMDPVNYFGCTGNNV